jgi:hypothetical protein
MRDVGDNDAWFGFLPLRAGSESQNGCHKHK